MNKQDLIEVLAKKVGIPKSQADKAINAIFTAIGDAVRKGDKAAFVGFGTFSVTKRKARTGRNPQTGATMKIPAKKVIKFSAGAGLKAKVK